MFMKPQLRFVCAAGRPVSIPRASKRGLANRIVDLAKQVEFAQAADVHVYLRMV
jgi:hypothetical protein